MFDSHRVVCSPSGRYICREKMVGEEKVLFSSAKLDSTRNASKSDQFMEIYAHKGKLYCPILDGLLTIDMDKYFNDVERNSTSLISNDHCTILLKRGPRIRVGAAQDGPLYLEEQGKDFNIYERIWEIDEKRGIAQFFIDKVSCNHNEECNSFNRILHPSGLFLEVEAHSDDYKMVDYKQRLEVHYWPKKCFTPKLVTFKSVPVRMDIPGTLDANQVIFNKSQNPEMYPSFVRDGRIRLTLLVDQPKHQSCTCVWESGREWENA